MRRLIALGLVALAGCSYPAEWRNDCVRYVDDPPMLIVLPRYDPVLKMTVLDQHWQPQGHCEEWQWRCHEGWDANNKRSLPCAAW